ncbi:MAG: hypothetical protein P0S94_00690 [Simkaniaceae bacterium]|nr:hypothetical protein [Simkaniaceae bacterium]
MSLTIDQLPQRKEIIPRAMPLAPYDGVTILNLSGQPLKTASAIGSLPSLKELFLISCHLKTFSPSILQCRKIEIVSIQDNNITTLPKAIGNWKHLTFFSAGNNPLKSEKPLELATLQITMNNVASHLKWVRKQINTTYFIKSNGGTPKIDVSRLLASLPRLKTTLESQLTIAPKAKRPAIYALIEKIETYLPK